MMYELPSTNSHRSCSFGFGTKVNFVEKEKSPPPGTYDPRTEFGSLSRYNTVSFHLGRNKVKFGNFLAGAERKYNSGPSPNAYRIRTEYFEDRRGGRIAAKLPTEIDLAVRKVTPGPGTYELTATEMKGSGGYILSNYPNHISPKYRNPSTGDKQYHRGSVTLGPGQCTFGLMQTISVRNSLGGPCCPNSAIQ
jgi:hypothetical protein